ncbi:methylated-DNA--[protein]-cysteine S-methyltransferase [Alteromonas sp. ASW11-19]|uniref:Methylated-DNA--protein-cysteine methyltransferase n=1 Tax=Alteromonas salexigens TaxID=2982530 RepID=A0ABT2VLY4_9ALTE|nr:methylated-DNA--[protein]-cysteine S-methyltransferase [Alteromonas salexigens]MCU7553453.1 methylated-DNA--[protein]-cysteine S-methyltransferase [Alteromonas salexigens]
MYTQHFRSACGNVTVSANDDGITAVAFTGNQAPAARPSPLTQQACEQLTAYFAGQRNTFDMPLAMQGTDFQRQVWQALLTLNYGETASYRDIAERIGNPKAVRAVGLANSKNPIAIVVPCHRVIGASGKLTGYAGGLERKRYLLNLEGVAV